uniref:protein S-acyltransferase n=1 Tax=Sphenodon punctatus TaxID=8508 RepID=A0A8D0H4C9_SPHPU
MEGGGGCKNHCHAPHLPNVHSWHNIHEDKDLSKHQEVFPFAENYSSCDIVKATQYGIVERCKELVEAGYDVRQPDKENVTLLHWAAINNRPDLVKYYISKGAVVDQLGGDLNSTPLHWAVRQGHLSVVILLLKCGADPTLIDGEGVTSTHLAVLFQHMPIIAYLVSKDQSIDTTDFSGQTPLMLSAQKIIGPEPTRFILKFNPSLNAVDKVHKNTALHWAVTAGNINAVDLLLEAGSRLDIKNVKGDTPLDLAHQLQNRLIIHMITEQEKMRARKASRLLRMLEKYEFFLLLVFSLTLMWAIGYIMDLNSDSWLLKGSLLFLILFGMSLFARQFVGLNNIKYLPAVFILGSMKKPLRSMHCHACNSCEFILTELELFLEKKSLYSFSDWSEHCATTYQQKGAWTFLTQIVSCSPWVLYISVLVCFHALWASLLLIIQLYQIAFLGLTSHERITLLKQSKCSKYPVSLRKNPYNNGCLQNLADFFHCRCLGLFKPNIVDWTSQYTLILHPATDKNIHAV